LDPAFTAVQGSVVPFEAPLVALAIQCCIFTTRQIFVETARLCYLQSTTQKNSTADQGGHETDKQT
jgi:hypothetical protein